MQIKFLTPNLPPIHKYIPDFIDIYKSGIYTNNGPKVQAFEQQLKDYLGCYTKPVCTNNATTALIIAIKALNIPKGSYVVVPSFTFAATVQALLWCDLKPLYCDISKTTWNMTAGQLRKTILTHKSTLNISAVIAVDVFGNLIDRNILEVANKYGIKVIVDSAESIGSKPARWPHYFLPDARIFSFHATKLLPVGEGGCMIFKDKEIESLARKMIDFGFGAERSAEVLGLNGKMNEFQAAIGKHSLLKLDDAVMKRNKIAKEYRRIFSSTWDKFNDFQCQLPEYDENLKSYQILGLLCPTKEIKVKLRYHLNQYGIETREYFNPPCHKQPYLKSDVEVELPVTDFVADRIISMPIWDTMGNKELNYIEKVMNKWNQ